MRRFVALASVLLSGTITASAADMPVKAPPMAAPYSWSGLYLGGSVGWAKDRYDWSFEFPFSTHQNYSFGRDDTTYGLHLGVQQQWNWLVLGFEAGWMSKTSWADEPGFGNNFALISQSRRGDTIEAGARVGVAQSNWLLYGTGGIATATLYSQGVRATGALVEPSSATHSGWYAGGGIEYAFFDNWVVGVEYQHISLNSELQCGIPGDCTSASSDNRYVSGSSDIVRGRLSYKFGWH